MLPRRPGRETAIGINELNVRIQADVFQQHAQEHPVLKLIEEKPPVDDFAVARTQAA